MKKLVVAIAAVAAVLVAILVLSKPFGWFENNPQAKPVTASQNASPTPNEAQAVAGALEAFPTDPVNGSAEEVKVLVASSPLTAAPAGTTIEPEPNTWESTALGAGTMTIKVTYPKSEPKYYLAFMTLEEGSWKLLYTIGADG
ncbi:hypothetical protein [Arthrobacter humicola]|uniref:hypothetical protein n=1 Tax=Arthrobacter humicola TaxID=409291 RepID=UPI0031DEDC5A